MIRSRHFKRAAIVIVLVAVVLTYRLFQGITMTGSRGLGAVSLGLSEALLEFVVLAVIVAAFFYWRARRERASRPPRRQHS